MTGRGSTVVVGGGLAGIAAAVRLADRGRQVTLLEARPRLGGATYSFTRTRGAAGPLVVDTGQHVLLRCYTAYRELLARLGTAADVRIQDRFHADVLRPGGGRYTLRRSSLPAPLHLAGGLLRYGALAPADRLRAARGAVALRALDPDDPGLDTVSFGAWLRAHGQPQTVIDRLWSTFAVAALNVPSDQASLALAAKVFRTGLLDAADAGDIGVPQVALSALHGDAAYATLQALGATVLLGQRVRAVEAHGDEFIVRADGRDRVADAVVLAVPHAQASTLVPDVACPDRARWAQLSYSPIVNVHLVFGERVTDLPFFAAVDSPVQWVFDRTRQSRLAGGQYLAVSLSAADEVVGNPARALTEEGLAALGRLLPRARDAEPIDAFVTREPHATFRGGPGTAALRPMARTRLPGLALAGAWTATGWPDTMEGAVRSGLHAADVLLTDYRDHESSGSPEQPPSLMITTKEEA